MSLISVWLSLSSSPFHLARPAIHSFPDSDSVFVHIIKSEQHAAMQHELGVRLELPNLWLLLLLLWAIHSLPRPHPLLAVA